MTFIGILIFVAGLFLTVIAVAPEAKRRLKDGETRRRVGAAFPPALHYPNYRAYWLGMLASVAGFRMFEFGQFWLAYQLTGSPLYLGYVSVAQAVPGVVLNLFGGVFADRLDKRRLIIITQVITAGLIFFLATVTALDAVNRWHVLLVAFLAGGVDAFNQPARQALFPYLIERRVMMSAVALNSTVWPGTAIVVPAIAGGIIALADTHVALYVASLGFLTMAVVVHRLNLPRIVIDAKGNPVQDLAEGLRFIVRNSIFSFLIAMTFFNSFFGISYQIMMPVFAVDVLKVGAPGQGMLLGVRGIGALITNLWWGSRTQVAHKGWLIRRGDRIRSSLSSIRPYLPDWQSNLSPGAGPHICHGCLQFNLHHLHRKLSSNDGAGPDAGTSHGFPWHDMEHHAHGRHVYRRPGGDNRRADRTGHRRAHRKRLCLRSGFNQPEAPESR